MSITSQPGEHLTPSGPDPRPAFVAMFEAVRAYLLTDGAAPEARAAVATNPKGEATRAFDARAEEIALAVARQRLGAFTVFSEEAGTLTIGAAPQWTLVLDPCDGSNNFRRGIRAVGFAVAALPVGAPLDPARVEYAVCGDVFTGAVYAAARGQGATLDGRPIHSAATAALERAVVGVNLGRERPSADSAGMEDAQAGDTPAAARVGELLHRISTLRRTGATVLDLCYVAEGAYDAYVDLRGRLTPENFLAPALVLHEAGARLTDAQGGPLGAVEFTQPYRVLAAGNQTLLAALLAALAG